MTSRCGQLGHRVALAQRPPAERLEREQRAGDAVAGAVEAHVDDVPGLLAAEHPAALAQRLQHVAVPDVGRGDVDLGVAHRGVEAVVGHHGHRDPAAGEAAGALEVQRRERHQLVAVDDLAGAVDGEHAVAVAVEGEADRVTAGAHPLGERARRAWSRSRR